MKILADASLPDLAAWFAKPFTLTTYNSRDELLKLLDGHDILLCRSTLKVGADLLQNTSIQCVATASSGTDHIDHLYLDQHGIALFDAKGSNARSVADYVVSTLALLQQQGKLTGSKAAIIGHGAVGSQVAQRLQSAGLEVICYDPLKAAEDKSFAYCRYEDLFDCDLLCIHANLHDDLPYPSKNLLDARFLAQLKPGVAIINAARGGIVDEHALLSMNKPVTYCTDVYLNEPAINPQIVDFSFLCTPHIAGHSIEAKSAAIAQLGAQLHRHYHLAMPALEPSIGKKPVSTGSNWQECVLSLYNPMNESRALKAASDKKSAFLSLRAAHKTRHDFIYAQKSEP